MFASLYQRHLVFISHCTHHHQYRTSFIESDDDEADENATCSLQACLLFGPDEMHGQYFYHNPSVAAFILRLCKDHINKVVLVCPASARRHHSSTQPFPLLNCLPTLALLH